MGNNLVSIIQASRILGITRQSLYERVINNPGLPFVKKIMIEKILIDTDDPFFAILKNEIASKKTYNKLVD